MKYRFTFPFSVYSCGQSGDAEIEDIPVSEREHQLLFLGASAPFPEDISAIGGLDRLRSRVLRAIRAEFPDDEFDDEDYSIGYPQEILDSLS